MVWVSVSACFCRKPTIIRDVSAFFRGNMVFGGRGVVIGGAPFFEVLLFIE